jgi:hypothetical protein
MIKLFRRIRHHLISSENKISRYFLYALGEIILVIIGILMALQINTWNESRKLANREAFVLGKLMEEFQADSTVLDRYIFLTDMKAERESL